MIRMRLPSLLMQHLLTVMLGETIFSGVNDSNTTRISEVSRGIPRVNSGRGADEQPADAIGIGFQRWLLYPRRYTDALCSVRTHPELCAQISGVLEAQAQTSMGCLENLEARTRAGTHE